MNKANGWLTIHKEPASMAMGNSISATTAENMIIIQGTDAVELTVMPSTHHHSVEAKESIIAQCIWSAKVNKNLAVLKLTYA